jgi:2-oxoisovalerate ferredoxin oxidoreductase beta subunit
MQAAQLGLPLTVVFINNAIYGMTGGQMAPTTLPGQKTTTSPYGRTAFMGAPLKMAELIAGIDGPIYVERVALFDAKQRIKAAKAIHKALRLQVEGKGFAFVEVLAECPTHLKLTPSETERWVKEAMLPAFPLGVKKDVPGGDHQLPRPDFTPERLVEVLGAKASAAARHAAGFPRTAFGRNVALKFAGAGGDGAQTAALLVTRAAINEGFDATHIPSYGPESRGGTSYADIRLAEDEVLSPAAPEPHVLVAFNAPSLAKFRPSVAPGGLVIYDSSVVADPGEPPRRVRQLGVPCAAIAQELGKVMVKNVVALGALQAATELLPKESLLEALREALEAKPALLPVNEQAFERGRQAVLSA